MALTPTLDFSAYDAMLKEYYTDDVVHNMVYADNPFLAMCSKNTKIEGKRTPVPINYGNSQGRSATFSKAVANKSAAKFEDFLITYDEDYSLADLDYKTMLASRGNPGAWLDAKSSVIDNAWQSIVRSLAISMFGSGTGKIGQIAASPAPGATITLTDPEDVTNFEVGMTIAASLTDGGGAGVKDQTVDIIAVDRSAGTVTFSADVTGLADAWAAADYLFVDGDYDAKIKGLEAWVPPTAPSATLFFGVARNVDTRLGGLRQDNSAKPIEEALIDGAKFACREGGRPDAGFGTYDTYGDLEKSLGSKVQYVNNQVMANIGFQGIKVNHNKGVMTLYADQNAVSDVVHMLTMSTWELQSIGDAPFVQTGDGNTWLRQAAADSMEMRIAYYAQLVCNAPGWNLRNKVK